MTSEKDVVVSWNICRVFGWTLLGMTIRREWGFPPTRLLRDSVCEDVNVHALAISIGAVLPRVPLLEWCHNVVIMMIARSKVRGLLLFLFEEIVLLPWKLEFRLRLRFDLVDSAGWWSMSAPRLLLSLLLW